MMEQRSIDPGLKIVATSYERYNGGVRIKRLYGSSTITLFFVHYARDAKNPSAWRKVEGYGPTPGDRKTDAIRRFEREDMFLGKGGHGYDRDDVITVGRAGGRAAAASGAHVRLTLAEAKAQVRPLGFSLKSREGEYLLIPWGEREGPKTYYTHDLRDAVDTARLVASRGPRSTPG